MHIYAVFTWYIVDERQVGAEASIFSGSIEVTSTYIPRILLQFHSIELLVVSIAALLVAGVALHLIKDRWDRDTRCERMYSNTSIRNRHEHGSNKALCIDIHRVSKYMLENLLKKNVKKAIRIFQRRHNKRATAVEIIYNVTT